VHGDEGAIGLLGTQHDNAVGRSGFQTLRHQAGAGAGSRQRIGIFVAFDEAKIVRAGVVQRGDIRDQALESGGITGFGPRQRNNLGYRQS